MARRFEQRMGVEAGSPSRTGVMWFVTPNLVISIAGGTPVVAFAPPSTMLAWDITVDPDGSLVVTMNIGATNPLVKRSSDGGKTWI